MWNKAIYRIGLNPANIAIRDIGDDFVPVASVQCDQWAAFGDCGADCEFWIDPIDPARLGGLDVQAVTLLAQRLNFALNRLKCLSASGNAICRGCAQTD